jgi:preprotein translocase subunit SecG
MRKDEGMNVLFTLVVVIQVLSALGVIVLVLLQHGKGADMGAAFGSGASGSLFGATGSANFLSRTTAALATVFLVSTLALSMLTHKGSVAPKSVMDQPAAQGSSVPAAAPAAATPGAETKPADGAVQKNGQSTEIPK